MVNHSNFDKILQKPRYPPPEKSDVQMNDQIVPIGIYSHFFAQIELGIFNKTSKLTR